MLNSEMKGYPLATSSWDEAEYAAMQKVIVSGQFTMGSHVAQYERDFSQYLNSPYSVMCSSGSTANLLMIAALFYRKNNPLKRGDEVIVPAVSWSTTYFPIHQYGLKLKFVDIDLETLNYDLESLEASITEKTKLIMVVNLLGNPNDFDRILSLAKKHRIEVVEDNCESLGAEYKSKQTGTFGLMGTYSSFFSHHISTMEGGIVTTADEELYHILLCLRAHGWTRNLPKENHVTGIKSDHFFEESFKFVLPGYNVRPLELSGAIGIEQMKKLPKFIETRRENAKVFQDLFNDHPHLLIQKEIEQSSWFGFSFVIRPGSSLKRSQLVEAFQKNQIECRPIVAGNFAKNQALKWMDYEVFRSLENAEHIDHSGLFVGNHQVSMVQGIKNLKKVIDQVV